MEGISDLLILRQIGYPKFVAIDEEVHDQIVHRGRRLVVWIIMKEKSVVQIPHGKLAELLSPGSPAFDRQGK